MPNRNFEQVVKSSKHLKGMLPRRPRVEFKKMKIRFSHVQNRAQFREHHPPVKVLQTGAKHQRSPEAPLSEWSTEWNEDMEEFARWKADDNHIGHWLEEGAKKLDNIKGNGEERSKDRVASVCSWKKGQVKGGRLPLLDLKRIVLKRREVFLRTCSIEERQGKNKITKPRSQRQFCGKAKCQKDGEKLFKKRGLTSL